MQILLTNDDGIFAPGLAALEHRLSQIGDVCVVAPATEQSGVGHSITFLAPIICKEVYDHERRRGWAVRLFLLSDRELRLTGLVRVLRLVRVTFFFGSVRLACFFELVRVTFFFGLVRLVRFGVARGWTRFFVTTAQRRPVLKDVDLMTSRLDVLGCSGRVCRAARLKRPMAAREPGPHLPSILPV